MKALVFDGQLAIQEVPLEAPPPGEVAIKVFYSSICSTDLEALDGYMGFHGILGHEFVGEVVTENSRFYGKDVVGEINCSCDNCFMCHTGRRSHCPNRTILGIFHRNGAFAEYLVLPEKNLHVVPANVDLPSAVFTEPLAAALEIFEQTRIKPTENVFIFGSGKLGLLIGQLFRLSGCEFTVFDINPKKVEFARGLGLTAREVRDLQPDEKAEICVECTGNAEGINLALSHLHPRGKLILKTTVVEHSRIDLNQIVINEFEIIGSRCGVFEPALSLLSQKLVDVEPMITRIFNFSQFPEAIEMARHPDTVKILIRH
jgi:alcohol dehydrogenase